MEYVLIEQNKPHVEAWFQQSPNLWSKIKETDMSKLGCTNVQKKFPVFLCCETNKNNEECVRWTGQKYGKNLEK